MRKACTLGWSAFLALAVSAPARAADVPMPVKAAAIGLAYNWAGLYFGGHVDYSRGTVTASLREPELTAFSSRYGSLYGGVQVGYNFVLPSQFLLGVEADVSFPNYLGPDETLWSATTARGDVTQRIDYVASLRGRFGRVVDQWLVYGTGGFALAQRRFVQTPLGSDDLPPQTRVRAGWILGAGVELGFARDWSARLEYLYSRFGAANVVFATDARYSSTMDMHTIRLALNRKFSWPGSQPAAIEAARSAPEIASWEIHGQTTYIQQGYPSFRSPYFGPNSLTPWPQTKQTWTTSAFLGVRLWEGGELYYNPELLQGFGLNSTFGAGGFPNGEAQKSSFVYPHYNTSRLFLRQTFGLGGEQETVDSDYGQLSGKRDVSRLTIQIGKFAVHDAFDNNAYASDPRVHFLNWSIWAAGAFDYPADKVGLTYGAVAELNQKQWALRAGYFLIGDVPNSDNLDTAAFRRGGYVTELETRYTLLSRPGKFRVAGWVNSAFSGSYRDAIDMTLANPGLDPTDAITRTRQGRIKYGYVLNLEQSVTDDIGLFGRWSWNDGRNEIDAFTDIDASLSFGTSIKGAAWGRPNDTIGIAGAVNGLSKDHRDYIAAGGLGILIGDGRLNYAQEKILEAFYAYNLAKGTTLTFDYQFLVNPAYNTDRGPVSIFTGRLHAEF